jgi:hypothetical protein
MFPDSPDMRCYFSLQVSFGYASLLKLSKSAKYLHIYLSTNGEVFHIKI